ncbi:MAG: sigma-70 family RNA polymerase sigma factor [Roseburia sp.]|nr:sigma-70 family RNA polymerase sigma factor [Roseburia sp.]
MDMNDKEKFSQLYERYNKLLTFIARGVLKNEVDVDDAVQQTWLYVWEHLEKLADVDSPQTKAYISTVVNHRALDIIRSKKAHHEVELTENIPETITPFTEYNGLWDALDALPERYKNLLLMRHYLGLETDEMAEQLGMRRQTIQKNLWRARNMLAQKLDELA